MYGHMAVRVARAAVACGVLGGCLSTGLVRVDGVREPAGHAARSATHAPATLARLLPAAWSDSSHHLDIGFGTVFPGGRDVVAHPNTPGYDEVVERAPAVSLRYRRKFGAPVSFYAGTTFAFLRGKIATGTDFSWKAESATMAAVTVGVQLSKETERAAVYWRAGAGALFWPEITGTGYYALPGPVIMGWQGTVIAKESGIMTELGLGVSCAAGGGGLFVDLSYAFGPAPTELGPGAPLSFDLATLTFGATFAF